jgi:hypothetical protein
VAEARGISLPELIELERENASALFERLRLD